jgi:hypothetical protein
MQFGTHFSTRKIGRKLDASGPRATCVAGAELLARKLLVSPIFATLLERGEFDSITRPRLLDAFEVHWIDSGSGGAERFVATVPDGRVLPGSGAVLTAGGAFVVESTSGPSTGAEFTTRPLVRHLFRDGPRFTVDLLRGDVRSLGPVDEANDLLCPLLPRYPNYYHWTIQTLPKIRLLESFRDATGREPTLLLPADPPSWMLESFRLLGGDAFPVRHVRAPVHRAESMLLPSFVETITGVEYEWFTRRTAGLRGDGSDDDHARRIYVSRSAANERRVTNADAVLDALSAYGFESYRLEELPVAEQVRLFADADVVVGPHGAGLSNLVYSEDVAVVELLAAQLKRNFERISDAAGFEYHRLWCRQDGPDIEVDVDELVEIVERVVD